MGAEVTILQALVDYTYDLVTAHTSNSFMHACDRDLWRKLTALQLSRVFTVGVNDTSQTSQTGEASEVYCMLPVVDLANHAPMPRGEGHDVAAGGAAPSGGLLEGGRGNRDGELGPNVKFVVRAADRTKSRSKNRNESRNESSASRGTLKAFDGLLMATRSIAKHGALRGSYTSNGQEREVPGLTSTNTALLLNFGMALANNPRDFASFHGTLIPYEDLVKNKVLVK